MANIVIIDDDYALEILVQNLTYRGHNVRRIDSGGEALSALDSVISNDLIVLDVIMQMPGTPSASQVQTAGMSIYREIRAKKPAVPILAYSATHDADLIEVFEDDPHCIFLPKWSTPAIKDIVDTIYSMLGITVDSPQPISFIVHGHNNAVKLELKNYLQNIIGLPEPMILHEQPGVGKTIIEKFEKYATSSNLVFVLLTPDDRIAGETDSDTEKRRARQNVIFEFGYFLGMLGRETGRVFLLYSGPLELPSDLSGVIYIDISKGIEAAGENIRKELGNVIKRTQQ